MTCKKWDEMLDSQGFFVGHYWAVLWTPNGNYKILVNRKMRGNRAKNISVKVFQRKEETLQGGVTNVYDEVFKCYNIAAEAIEEVLEDYHAADTAINRMEN